MNRSWPKGLAALALVASIPALFLTCGTPCNRAVLPLMSEFGVLLAAPSTGAMARHKPVRPSVFNMRAS